MGRGDVRQRQRTIRNRVEKGEEKRMDISFLNDYLMPVILGLCLCLGWVIKHWIDDVDNKVIPTVCAALGVCIAVWMNWRCITPEVILMGMASGLASTGLHQAVTQLLGKEE